jgi:hypothetical protein
MSADIDTLFDFPSELAVIAVRLQSAGLKREASVVLDAGVLINMVAGELVALRTAIEADDPKAELLQRVADAMSFANNDHGAGK